MIVILFLGYSGGGKTYTIQFLCKSLKKRGFKVGVIKGIHERDFTIDTPGKDTWRFSRSGASVVVAVSQKEIALIRKERNTSSIETSKLISMFKRLNVDYLLVEGLHKRFERIRGIKKVICARNEKEAIELAGLHKGKILFLTGKFANKYGKGQILKIPVVSLSNGNKKVLAIISGTP